MLEAPVIEVALLRIYLSQRKKRKIKDVITTVDEMFSHPTIAKLAEKAFKSTGGFPNRRKK
jgi:hypothetical protein